jgi:hypothetical protein
MKATPVRGWNKSSKQLIYSILLRIANADRKPHPKAEYALYTLDIPANMEYHFST